MKVGDSIKKRLDELKNLSDEELKEWADAMLEDAKNKTFVPCKPPEHSHCRMQPEEINKQVDELYEESIKTETEIFKILPVLHRFEKDLL